MTQIASIVATLGPVSFGLAKELAAAGATAFRFNASHLTPERLDALLSELRATLPEHPVVVDLQGAKMRLGEFEPRPVACGERVRFALQSSGGNVLPLPHPELFSGVAPGETLSCDDDRLRFRVCSVNEGALEVVSLTDGVLRPRKGLNLLEHPVRLADLTSLDQEHVRLALRHADVAFAVSFMLDGVEAEWVRRRAPAAPVIGKVERREAIDQLEPLAEAVDGIWICRGDLGAQLGSAELAEFIAGFRPAELEVPVLIAGQVLEHLTEHPEPTRSEVCHLFDLMRRGYVGIVLSDETAIGRDPVNAVRKARGLIEGRLA